MSANSVFAPQDGMTRPESSEYFAGTGRNELSECHSRSPSLKNHTRSSADMIRPSLSRLEKSAMLGPSRCSSFRRVLTAERVIAGHGDECRDYFPQGCRGSEGWIAIQCN